MGAIAVDGCADAGAVVSDLAEISEVLEPSELAEAPFEPEPDVDPFVLNAFDLERDLAWLARVLETRFHLYFGPPDSEPEPEPDGEDDEPEASGDAAPEESPGDAPPSSTLPDSIFEVTPPDLSGSSSHYAGVLAHYEFNVAERLILLMALVPHVRPQLFDMFHHRSRSFDRRFTEFGGLCPPDGGHFQPTGETAAFVIAGDHLADRFAGRTLFHPNHFFARHRILSLDTQGSNESLLKAPLRLSDEFLSLLTQGEPHVPNFGPDFPAQRISSALEWEDLVLPAPTLAQLEELEAWLRHGPTLMREWGMEGRLRPGYRCLFHGPPGTGKTMTACLLGKMTGKDVFKVDLSQVLSKYIGETERNLGKVFDQAESKGWILFFDEADALFGKRTETKDAHDRFANQEVSFLLQRIETFDGVAILASNLRENMDDAFARRFESMVRFPLPGPEQRLQLWRRALPAQCALEEGFDLGAFSRAHDLSGGAIMNVVRFAALRALSSGSAVLRGEDLVLGVRREYAKEGKVG